MKFLTAILLCLLATGAMAAPSLFDQVMAALKAAPVTSAHFTETKTMAVVDAPVVSSGQLSYAPPDRIEKVTTSPAPETLLLDGTRLAITRDGQTHVISIDDRPEIAVFVTSVRDLLAGDGSDLVRQYNVVASGTIDSWKLELTPLDAEAQKLVQSITVAGAKGMVGSIVTRQGDGDSTSMTITKAGAVTLSRWLPFAVWAGGLLIAVLCISRTPITSDMSAFLPRRAPEAQQVLVNQMRNGTVSRLLLVGIEGAPPAQLAAASVAMTKTLSNAPDIALVRNGEAGSFDGEQAYYWKNRYALSDAVTPGHFDAPDIHAALQHDLAMLGSSMAPMAKKMLPADPTGEALSFITRMEGGVQPETRNGVWMAEGGKRALILIETRKPGFDLDAAQKTLAEIHAATPPGVQIVMTGTGVIATQSQAHIKGDAARLSTIATAMVALLLLLVYRSPRVLAVALLPVATGAIAGLAAVAAGFGYVHGITLGFGVTLIGEGVDYAIYLFTQTAPGAPATATIPRIWRTLRLGTLTSLAGFGAMLSSRFTGFAQLGLFTMTGLVAALATTRWVLPRLLPQGFSTRLPLGLGMHIGAALALAPRLRWLPMLVLIAAIAMIFHDRDHLWQDRLQNLNPRDAAQEALDKSLRDDFGRGDNRYLAMIAAPGEDQVLEASRATAIALQSVVATGALKGFSSPDQILPGARTQAARRAVLPDEATLRGNLALALEGLPFHAETFAPFLVDVAKARAAPPMTRGDVEATALGLKLNAMLSEMDGHWVALLPLNGVSDEQAIGAALATTGAKLVDLKSASDNLLSTYRGEALELAGGGAAAIALLLLAALRSLSRTIVVLSPLAVAVSATTALLLALGHPLSIYNLFGLLLIVAVGSNYALFFEAERAGSPDRPRTVLSLMLANACAVIGFGILSFSRVPLLSGIGSTVAIGVVMALVFSAILIPPRSTISSPA